MSPPSHMTEVDQISDILSCLDQYQALLLKVIKPNPSKHGHMRCGRASYGYYPKSCKCHVKITAMSNQPKRVKIVSFCSNYVRFGCL